MFSQTSLLSLGLVATGSLVAADSPFGPQPCDIYWSGGTPCVAAHSTTRALYEAYNGPLYQVQRGSDNATTNIVPLIRGGIANAARQDFFCARTTCLITIIYDQSGHGNHLTQALRGAFGGPDFNGADNLASATGAPVRLHGVKAYGVFISPGAGYRNNAAVGTATGDEPEGMYAVLDGTHYNGGCCFDYGNAEINSHDTGNGHMEAIYFGNSNFWGTGTGSGPWVMADLENGLFSGESPKENPDDLSITSRFVTAVVKGEPNHWSIRAADSVSGELATYFNGSRPSVPGYNPMHKEGAIILGTGGDNSNGAQGTFYEGVMTSGYPSDAIEDLVQANIRSVKYEITSLTSGPALQVGSTVSLRATTAHHDETHEALYMTHNGATINTQVISPSSSTALKDWASWTVRTGLANSGCFSFESKDTPGSFIRHAAFKLSLNANDDSMLFAGDATFCSEFALNGQGNSIRSWSYPARYFRQFNSSIYIASNGGDQAFDNATTFSDDASWEVSTRGFV
jgi:hypothetical protein